MESNTKRGTKVIAEIVGAADTSTMVVVDAGVTSITKV
jgi:hypothetical protein